MEIIDRVPFDLVAAYHEREAEHGRLVGASKGPIGKLLRRHRKDASTTLIHTMLKACVEKRWDSMLWDTFAEAAQREMSYFGPAADFRQDPALVPDLLKRLASLAMAGSKPLPAGAGHVSGTLATASAQASISISGRKHRRRTVSHETGSKIGVTKARFPEYALLAGMAAANHYGLGQRCADEVSKLAARADQGCSGISSHVLCRLLHHAGGLIRKSGSADTTSLTKLLQGAIPELRRRLGHPISAGDMCLIAHAYAHAGMRGSEASLLKDLKERLLKDEGVSLLKLSPGELSNLLNAFARSTDAAKNSNVELFDRLGRQLLKAFHGQRGLGADSQDTLDLRNACVSLNAFAQASLRHEPFFFACEEHLPELVYSDECEVRQLAMIAHAYVRVGLVHSSLLPLVWDRATRLAPHCDAQGVALMIFATTKAAVTETSGLTLLRALSCRLLELLKGQSLVPQQTIAVSTYALAKSGYKDCVDKAVWSALAYHARCKLRQFSMTEAANLASAFAEVLKDNIEETENTTLELRTFFDDLLVEVRRRMASENLRMRSLPLLPPPAAAKFIVAFGDVKCYAAAGIVQELARRFLLPAPQVPLRAVVQALGKLHVYDEDLMQALTMAQKATARRRSP